MELDPTEFERGKQQGHIDATAGTALLYWQTRGAWGELLTRLMAERFSVTVQHVSDLTDYVQRSFRDGYNRVVIEDITRRYGPGAFELVISEVEAFRQRQYQQYLESSAGTAGTILSPSD